MVTKKKSTKKPTKKKIVQKKDPPWMKLAMSRIGVKEKSGPKSNKEILGWAAVVGGKVFRSFTNDQIPWCGLFIAWVFAEVGIKPVKDSLWARNWANFGKNLQKVGPCYGCVMVFKRGKGGHVGLYHSESGAYYNIVGGNQGDSVSIARVAKKRCISWNWQNGHQYNKFYKPGRVYMSLAKAKISRNERGMARRSCWCLQSCWCLRCYRGD